jgi:hypothetical protein
MQKYILKVTQKEKPSYKFSKDKSIKRPWGNAARLDNKKTGSRKKK